MFCTSISDIRGPLRHRLFMLWKSVFRHLVERKIFGHLYNRNRALMITWPDHIIADFIKCISDAFSIGAASYFIIKTLLRRLYLERRLWKRWKTMQTISSMRSWNWPCSDVTLWHGDVAHDITTELLRSSTRTVPKLFEIDWYLFVLFKIFIF